MLKWIAISVALFATATPEPAPSDTEIETRLRAIGLEILDLGMGSVEHRVRIEALVGEAKQLAPDRGRYLELLEQSHREPSDADRDAIFQGFLQLCQERDYLLACSTYVSHIRDTRRADADAQAWARTMDDALCERGVGASCAILAEIYQRGLQVDRDLEAARDYAQRGCDLQSGSACGFLAENIRETEPMSAETIEQTGSLLEMACARGHARSCRLRAGDFENGLGGNDSDRAEAFKRRACALNGERDCR